MTDIISAAAEIGRLYTQATERIRVAYRQKELYVADRWEIGRILVETIGERQAYGSGALEKVAQDQGIEPNWLYECKSFYLAVRDLPGDTDPRQKLESWFAEKREQNGAALWGRDVRQLIYKRPEGPSPLRLELKRIEQMGIRLDARIQRFNAAVREDTDLVIDEDEVDGVLQGALDTSVESGILSGPSYPRDPAHLAFVRKLPCMYPVGHTECGRLGTQAHHTESGGEGIKGSDYSCVPLCPEHHDMMEEKHYPWCDRALSNVFHLRFAGRRLYSLHGG